MSKLNLPNSNSGGANNLTSEYAQMSYLYSLYPRSTTGEATFTNVSFYGTVNIVADDGNGNYARGSANLTYFGTYVVSLTMNFATLNFISDNAALVGKNLDLKIGNKTITTFQLSLVAGTTDTYMGTVYVDRLATYKVDT